MGAMGFYFKGCTGLEQNEDTMKILFLIGYSILVGGVFVLVIYSWLLFIQNLKDMTK